MNAKQRRKQNRKYRYKVKLDRSVTFILDVTAWLHDHNIDYVSDWYTWSFAKEEDAVFFKLKWLK